ncbi:serine/threonine-protein phosphatase 6 regulatory ankyrin repeat subunit C-like [Dreissena polymorpha]|uniref:Uncharacterized protein n=1 Tax=Dreissena polymorpha TaxID=45954 RepID=A0A9D4QPA1_DREPO|nr:serine/threonine-protein phosphatase 6 regulatory ankyrin repeat subunit C-like [Dreissena polymorpha]KAH3838273.1 hypothetical protein DPMN_111681 [Dreissena polymorpha]
MVGVVLGQPNHKMYETIELCPRDFLMSRIRLDIEETDEICVAVGKDKYLHLCKKVTSLILRKNCNSNDTIDATTSEISQEIIEQIGQRYALIPIHNLDFGILKHPIFLNEQFVKIFIQFVKRDNLEQEMVRAPVMKMIEHFLDYGIRMNEMTMCIPGYALYSKINVLARELVENNFFYSEDTDFLLLAAHSGDLETVELLLSMGAKVTGDTIHVAMHRPDLSCLKAILQHAGFDINDKGHAINGNYPIIVASQKGLFDAVKCLLEYGADPSVQNDKQLTALHKAVIYEQSEIVKELLTHNAPLEIKDCKFKRTPLHIAADIGTVALVAILLAKGANVKDYRGHYPIFLAAIRGHTPTVEELLKHDRKQDQLRIKSYGKKSFIKGMSLFHVAVWKKDKYLMEMLIRERADPNLRDFFGRTALFFAIMKGFDQMINMLLPYADKSIPQKQGYTPLHAAVFKRNTIISDIWAASVDVNTRDKYGRTPLHVACEKGEVIIAKLLLIKYKADHRLITKRGDTVCHILRRKKLNKSRTRIAHHKRRAIEFLIRMVDPTYFECFRKQTNDAGISIDEPIHLTLKDAKMLVKAFKFIKNAEHVDENTAKNDGNYGGVEYADIIFSIVNAVVKSDGSAAIATAYYGDDGYCFSR